MTLSAIDDQEEYWNFSWDDMALDVKASMKYITENNKADKGFYYGWS